MNCCNDMGNCTQGRDCPIRKQRAQEANNAYINRGRWVGDPLEDVAATFRGLVTWVAVVGITGLAFWAWVKP